MELHTYSSLNIEFLKEYRGALDSADSAVVFYSKSAFKIKQLDEISKEQIARAFNRNDLLIYTDLEAFRRFLFSENLSNTSLLLMSSGNYGGLDFGKIRELF